MNVVHPQHSKKKRFDELQAELQEVFTYLLKPHPSQGNTG